MSPGGDDASAIGSINLRQIESPLESASIPFTLFLPMRRSTDASVNWGHRIPVVSSGTAKYPCSLEVSGSTLFFSGRMPAVAPGEVFYKRSTDDGNTWGSETPLTRTANLRQRGGMREQTTQLCDEMLHSIQNGETGVHQHTLNRLVHRRVQTVELRQRHRDGTAVGTSPPGTAQSHRGAIPRQRHGPGATHARKERKQGG